MDEAKRIDVGRGRFALVDATDHEELSRFKWHTNRGGYVMRNSAIPGTRKTRGVQMHRYILKAPHDLDVDHINFDKLDNRRCNIRLVTTAQNTMKARLSKRNRCGLKGASQWGSGWKSRITAGGVTHYLGFFKTAADAARAYDAADRRLHGEFAVVNFSSPAV